MFLEKAHRGYNKWYLYVFTLLVTFLSTQIASIPLVLYTLFHAQQNDASPRKTLEVSISQIPATNLGLALTLLGFAGGVIALLLCVKFLHRKQPTDILTGRKRFDGKRCLFGAAAWGLLTLVVLGIQYGVCNTSELVFQFQPGPFFAMCLVLLALLPFQVAFEEFIFRGYLLQACALLFRYRWIAVVITGLLFGLLHGSNPEVERFGFWIAMPQYVIIGLLFGYVTVKDDGLELALGIHFINNLLASILVTQEAAALQTHALFQDLAPTASLWDTVMVLACGIIFVWMCNRKYHFMDKIDLRKRI